MMRPELRQIDELLAVNGWVLSVPAKEGEMSEYVRQYPDGNVIGIEIALEDLSLGCYGHYGVGSVQIVKFQYDPPYIREDMRQMVKLIDNAEQDLLKAGIPFRPTYGFGKNLEFSLGDNLELRDKYHLKELEEIDWGEAQGREYISCEEVTSLFQEHCSGRDLADALAKLEEIKKGKE